MFAIFPEVPSEVIRAVFSLKLGFRLTSVVSPCTVPVAAPFWGQPLGVGCSEHSCFAHKRRGSTGVDNKLVEDHERPFV